MTRVLYLVNGADSQSIPYELGEHIRQQDDEVMVASFYPASAFPLTDDEGRLDLKVQSALDLDGFRRLRRLLLSYRPELVHVHHTASALWIVAMRFLGVRFQLIKTEHNDHRFQKRYQKMANLVILGIADAVICNSDSTQRSFSGLEKRLAGDKVQVLYNGVDVARIDRQSGERAAVRKRLQVTDEEILLGTAVRFVPQKNLTRLIDAFGQAQARSTSPMRLCIIGDGPLHGEISSQIAALGLGENVLLPGPMSRDEVYQCLHAFDRYVMLSSWEGFCNAAVEALVARLPLLASDIVTLREVLGHHVDYVDPTSVEAMVSGLLSCAEGSRTDVTLDDARQYAIGRYGMERAVGAHLEAYAALKAGG